MFLYQINLMILLLISGSFAPAGPGTIWKKSSQDRIEIEAYKKLMKDPLASMVPHFYKDVEYNGECILR